MKLYNILYKFAFKNKGDLQIQLLIFFFLLMVLIAFFISATLYIVFEDMMTNEIGRSRVDVLIQIGERARVIKSSVITLSNLYYFDKKINKVVHNPSYNKKQDRVLMDNLSEIATKYKEAFKKINLDFYSVILADNGFKYCSLQEPQYGGYKRATVNLWFKDVIKRDGNIYWVSSYNDSDDNKHCKYVFSAARVFKNKTNGKQVGALLINVEERILYNTYKNVLNGKNSIYIIDEKGSFVSHRDENVLGINFFDMNRFKQLFIKNDFRIIIKGGKKTLISKYFDPESGWTIVEEIPFSELMAPLNKIRFTIFYVFILCAILAFVLSYIFAKKVSMPLKTFCYSMKQVQDGNLDVISDIKGWDEIRQLSDGFNRMVAKVKELLENIKEKEKLKRKAELDFLQAQINPHFLYNTLFSIKCMVSMGKNIQAEEMLTAFITLLKNTLNGKDEFITIGAEIECLKEYVLIQKYRYSNKFKILYDIPSDISTYLLPKLILQPIVENSIFHGIEPKKGRGTITVRAFKKNDDIIFKISDDGIGMDGEKIKLIWRNNTINKGRQFNLIGIVNVHERIQLNFGKSYGIKIFSQPGEGTEIEVIIPAIV
jgi:two-component system sensor histidine kinase YesM